MSRVCNCILSFLDCSPLKVVAEVNKYFDKRVGGGVGGGFVSIADPSIFNPDWYGGSKRLETDIAIGAFNYLDVNGLVCHLASMRWGHPEELQLLVKDQEDSQFHSVTIL